MQNIKGDTKTRFKTRFVAQVEEIINVFMKKQLKTPSTLQCEEWNSGSQVGTPRSNCMSVLNPPSTYMSVI